MSGVTERDIPWLVYGAQRLREETYGCKIWDKQGTDVIFARELVGMNFQTAVELVVAHSVDPDAKTPAAIKRPFKPDTSAARKRSGPPKRAEECPHHPGQYADNCGGCHADELADDDPDAESPAEDLAKQALPNALTGPAAVRAALRGGA